MAKNTVFLVLIVRDAGLRSSLAARLSMSSADLLSVESFDDSRIARGRLRHVVLIADQAAIDGYAAGLATLVDDTRWQRVVLVTDAPGADSPRLTHLAPTGAAAAIIAMLPAWQGEALG